MSPQGEGVTQTVALTTVGDTGSWTVTIPTAGAYIFRVSDLGNVGAFFAGRSMAPHLFESYAFRVEQ